MSENGHQQMIFVLPRYMVYCTCTDRLAKKCKNLQGPRGKRVHFGWMGTLNLSVKSNSNR